MAVEYPVRLVIPQKEEPDSWKVLFQWWLFVIPHWTFLAFLGVGVLVAWVISFFSILFTGEYPRILFNYIVGVQRWGIRVSCYMAMLRDEYPPFSFDDDYPVTFEVAYPERLSKRLVLVKWILVIPHLLIVDVLGNFIFLLSAFDGVYILLNKRSYTPFVELRRGALYWTVRVWGYISLYTDTYPPFSFDETAPLEQAQTQTTT